MKKRALSPVITTVLLILIVLILALLVFLWARGFLRERLSKFGDPIENSCDNVRIDASSPRANVIVITNTGNVPVYRFGFSKNNQAETDIEYSSVNETLIAGTTKEYTYSTSGVSRIDITPVLLGKNDEGRVKEYPCLNDKVVINI